MMHADVLSAPLSPSWWSSALHALASSPVGLALRTACPLLLALGLASRPVAAAMLLQGALLPGEMSGPGSFWLALLAGVLLRGAGLLSLDHLLRRGSTSIALPGVASVCAAFDTMRRAVEPAYRLSVRVWLAAAPAGLALGALSVTNVMVPGAQEWLPQVPSMMVGLPAFATLSLAILLAAGAATRFAALVFLLMVPFSDLTAGDVRLSWALLLAGVVLYGGGPYAVDRWLAERMGKRESPGPSSILPHVVVIGGGFGGLAAVRGLDGAACRVTLVDQRNYHLFQPLLYQVATASLSPADIATPVRSLVRDQSNVQVLLGRVTGIDPRQRNVLTTHGPIPYDVLIIATGARHSYFGRPEWETFAPGLKSIEDGTAIRHRLLIAFEEAENAATEADRQAWLTFVVVGGGPTGVELAGAIAELARYGLAEEFRNIDPAAAQVVLAQSGPRLLPSFPEVLSHAAEKALSDLGVEVRLDSRVEVVTEGGVTISGAPLPARTVLWAAGVMASPAAKWLGVAPDRAGRVLVEQDLTVARYPDVFVVGDTAASLAWSGQLVPGLAPAARQGGAYAARVIRSRIAGRPLPPPFRYHHLGSLATIGRKSAVAEFGPVRLHGALAWWLWGAAHVTFLVGGRNRTTVLMEWLWAYLTFRRGIRLITGGTEVGSDERLVSHVVPGMPSHDPEGGLDHVARPVAWDAGRPNAERPANDVGTRGAWPSSPP